MLDADIRDFFGQLDRVWLRRFLEHRIADPRVLRLVDKWLAAGVVEDGIWSQTERGSAQGASVSPLLANVYLHYVFDLWVDWWRRHEARGDVIVVRFADDFTVGFQHRDDADRFLSALGDRFAKFGLELHPDKTRLIEFGRYAVERRRARGLGRPETFSFLGFTHRLARGPTVRQLLSHTSGIPDMFTPDLVDAIDTDPTRSWTAEQVLTYVTDPLDPPGPPVMSYSNSNYLLLGLLIERVTGLSYPAAVRRDLLPGLGERINVQDAETPAGPVAAPNLAGTTTGPDGQFLPNRSWASVAGAAGGITADAATLARWGYRLYGGQILPAAPTVDLTTPVAPGYGLGTEILEQRWAPTGGVIGHHGGLPGYATVLLVNPQRQLAIAVLVPGDPGPTIDTLAKRLLTLMRA